VFIKRARFFDGFGCDWDSEPALHAQLDFCEVPASGLGMSDDARRDLPKFCSEGSV
jgi:hypothetical protein